MIARTVNTKDGETGLCWGMDHILYPLYLNLAVNKYDVLWLTLFQFYINFTPELLKVNPNIANVFNEFWLMLMLGMKV